MATDHHIPQTHYKPHAVCVPFPAQGHINPFLKLAALLHHRGFFITFVNTDHIQERLQRSKGLDYFNSLQDFQFETIPDGLPPRDDADSSQDTISLCESTRKNCLAPFRDLLVKLNSSKNDVPPVTCIIFDAIMSTFPVAAAKEIGVVSVCFRATNARVLICNKHLILLFQKGILPLKDSTSDYLNTKVEWIPTLENFRLRDLPTFFRTTDVNDFMLNYIIEETERSSEASALILNTFDALESDVLEALSPMCPPIYTIGPIHLLCKQLPQNGLKLVGASLWKEEQECLQWLDSKENKSVVYVNFGSIAVITPQQLVEFAWGLANSKKEFLWIIRPNAVVGDHGDSTAALPNEFLEETKERGRIARWCPQEKVLAHPSVGVFLTHCGWNSTVESLASGVPMICWPFFADQQLNCRCACIKWAAAVEINNNVNRYEVEKIVKEFIDGEEGVMLRSKATEWKAKAEAATATDGSSYMNFEKLVKEILLSIK